MLVLSRQKDESIIIGDNIEITIVDIRGDKVRLGINAPKNIPVHRKEIWLKIQKEGAVPKKIPTNEKGNLVLSRQKDESIMIGDDVEIMIVDVRGNKVRLGITAPNSIPVHRKEVWLKI